MSCKDEAEKEGDALEAATKTTLVQVDGGQRCTHWGCTAVVNQATGRCAAGHYQDAPIDPAQRRRRAEEQRAGLAAAQAALTSFLAQPCAQCRAGLGRPQDLVEAAEALAAAVGAEEAERRAPTRLAGHHPLQLLDPHYTRVSVMLDLEYCLTRGNLLLRTMRGQGITDADLLAEWGLAVQQAFVRYERAVAAQEAMLARVYILPLWRDAQDLLVEYAWLTAQQQEELDPERFREARIWYRTAALRLHHLTALAVQGHMAGSAPFQGAFANAGWGEEEAALLASESVREIIFSLEEGSQKHAQQVPWLARGYAAVQRALAALDQVAALEKSAAGQWAEQPYETRRKLVQHLLTAATQLGQLPPEYTEDNNAARRLFTRVLAAAQGKGQGQWDEAYQRVEQGQWLLFMQIEAFPVEMLRECAEQAGMEPILARHAQAKELDRWVSDVTYPRPRYFACRQIAQRLLGQTRPYLRAPDRTGTDREYQVGDEAAVQTDWGWERVQVVQCFFAPDRSSPTPRDDVVVPAVRVRFASGREEAEYSIAQITPPTEGDPR